MAGLTGGTVEKDESGDAVGVDALNRGEVEREGLAADERHETVEETAVVFANEIGEDEFRMAGGLGGCDEAGD